MAGRGAVPLRDGEGARPAPAGPAAGARTRWPPVPHEPAAERARRRRTPLLSDPAAPAPTAPPTVERRRAPPAPPRAAAGTAKAAGHAGAVARRSHRPRPVPRSSAVRLGKAASGERSETRPPAAAAPAVPSRRTDAPALSSVPSLPPETPPAGAGPGAAARLALRRRGARPRRRVRAAARRRGVRGRRSRTSSARSPSTLAFLRRRLTGDYERRRVRLRRGLHRARLPAAAAAALPVAGSGSRCAASRTSRPRAAALVVANHSGTIALDSLMTQVAVHDEHPAHRHLRMLGADLVFQTPFVGARRPQVRLDPGGQRRRRAAAGRRRAGRGLARGLQGRRQAVQRALQAAAVRPRRLRRRRRCAPGCRSSRARSSGAEEIYPIIGNMKTRRPAARAAVRADHPDLPAARAARPDPAAEQVDHRVRGADRDRRRSARARPTTRCWSSTSPTRSARRSSRRSTRC